MHALTAVFQIEIEIDLWSKKTMRRGAALGCRKSFLGRQAIPAENAVLVSNGELVGGGGNLTPIAVTHAYGVVWCGFGLPPTFREW